MVAEVALLLTILSDSADDIVEVAGATILERLFPSGRSSTCSKLQLFRS